MPPTTTPKTSATTKAKRKTAEELERERAEKKLKKDEKEAEKARINEERARLNAEREAVKKAKAAEKAKLDAEREELRRKKDEEEQAILRKKEKQQNLMASFFKRGPATPVKKKVGPESIEKPAEIASPATRKDAEPEVCAYDRQFKPFFIKPGVSLALSPFEMDQETKDTKSRILDEHIQNKRGEYNPHPFNPIETFQLSGLPRPRGIMPQCVKEIMEQVYGSPLTNTFDMAPVKTESQDERLATVQDKLDPILMKYLSFYEDVRPPYFGTITTRMHCSTLRKICVNPTRRTLNSVNYNYDSEAEWVEDEGEDLDDCEDDEEDDIDEELEDFLDDSEDALAANRPAFIGELQPTSTGLCFENRKRLGPCATLYKYKLEVMLGMSYKSALRYLSFLTEIIDTLEHHSGIDPFSSTYWEPMSTTGEGAATATTGTMPPPTAPATTTSKPTLNNDHIPKELLEEFKQAVVSQELREHTKSTMIDLLAKRFTACTKGQLRATLDSVAERTPVPGGKKSVKHWSLKP